MMLVDEETYTFIEKTWRDCLDFQSLTGQILHDLLGEPEKVISIFDEEKNKKSSVVYVHLT